MSEYTIYITAIGKAHKVYSIFAKSFSHAEEKAIAKAIAETGAKREDIIIVDAVKERGDY